MHTTIKVGVENYKDVTTSTHENEQNYIHTHSVSIAQETGFKRAYHFFS